MSVRALTDQQLNNWEKEGFLVLEGFADATTCDAMFNTAVAISRSSANDEPIGDTEVVLETAPSPASKHPEDLLAKIFRVHHQGGIFAEFLHRPRLGDLLEDLLGHDVDCCSC